MNTMKNSNDSIRPLHAPRLLAALLGVLLLAAAPALAEDGYDYERHERKDSDFGRAGGYLSGGIGGAAESFDFNTGGFDFGTALTLGARLGYRFNRFFALEGTFDYTVKGFEASAGPVDAEFDALLSTATVKLYPIDGRIQPFVLGGGGVLHTWLDCDGGPCGSADETEFAGRVGGGLDIYIFPNFALSGEVAYVIPTGDLDDYNFVTFGAYAMLRF